MKYTDMKKDIITERERLLTGDDQKACEEAFDRFVNDRENNPEYKALIARYRDAKAVCETKGWITRKKAEMGRISFAEHLQNRAKASQELNIIKLDIFEIYAQELAKR